MTNFSVHMSELVVKIYKCSAAERAVCFLDSNNDQGIALTDDASILFA